MGSLGAVSVQHLCYAYYNGIAILTRYKATTKPLIEGFGEAQPRACDFDVALPSSEPKKVLLACYNPSALILHN